VDVAGVNGWLARYVAAWESRDRAEIAALFTEDARYGYHPYKEPVVGREAVVDAWLEDEDEPGSFEAAYECYAVDGDRAVATGTSTYVGDEPRVYDNVFLLRFAADGRCSEFTDYYVKRP
jgi:ketosteroid isomerase-like protein